MMRLLGNMLKTKTNNNIIYTRLINFIKKRFIVITKTSVYIYKICDYIPVISTASNLTLLFQKYVVMPFLDKNTVNSSHYWSHIQDKESLRYVTALLPILGNILIIVKDITQSYKEICARYEKTATLAAVEKDGLALCHASEELRSNRTVVLAAVSQDGCALEFASEELRNNRDVVLAAVKQNGYAFFYASEELRKNETVLLAALEKAGPPGKKDLPF